MLTIESNIPDVTLTFERLRREQVPFATALAVNEVAQTARDAETVGIFARFTIRRPARLRTSVQVSRRAKKTAPDAIVEVRDVFLVQHEEGETRRRGDIYKSLVQPVGAREKRVGVLRGRNTPSEVLASNRKAFITRTRSGKVGVFRRIGDSRLPIELIFSFEREAKLRKLLKFGATVQGVAVREWNGAFGRGLAKAMATSR